MCVWKTTSAARGPKPTFLYSNYRWIELLYLPLPDREWDADMSKRSFNSISAIFTFTVEELLPKWNYLITGDIPKSPTLPLRYVDSEGVLRICGGADLKSSQYYPTLLGRAVAELYQKHREEVRALMDQQE